MVTIRLEDVTRDDVRAEVVTIGNFDGVHRGHQVLARTAVAIAKRRGLPAAALTFDPHPAKLLAPEDAPQALSTLQQKAFLLEELGVALVIVLPFSAAVASLAAEEFVQRILVSALGARCVVVGSEFRFGRARRGDVPTLKGLGATLGFEVIAVASVREGGVAVSSTRVRSALEAGDVVTASALLGRPYSLEGTVVEGDRRGRELGFPTVNLAAIEQQLPCEGVYAGRCRFLGDEGPEGIWTALINIGRRPTFGGGEARTEAHLLGFSLEVYGRPVALDLWERIRAERRFESAEDLRAQIVSDIARAQRLLPG